MPLTVLTGGFSLFCWILFLIFFAKDRSRYRNCYLLFFALLTLVPFFIIVADRYDSAPVVVMFYAVMLAILIVPFFLIYNGIVMIRKEGRHLSQLLSLGFGVAILAGEAIVLWGLYRYSIISGARTFIPRTFLSAAAAVFCVTVIYGSLSFLIFMIYTLFLQVIPRKRDFDYVIIHGSGLLHGDRVSRLLSDRLDKAIEIYRRDPTPPVLIPSGGKGADETIPEAEAMKRYLIARGIPEKDIIPEDRSTTTLENLRFSKEILDSREGRKYTALVSSNYHVFRALRYCRVIGLKCTGVGSRVAFYYWPSALIREYIAIHAEPKHAVLFIAGWLLCVVPLLVLIFR